MSILSNISNFFKGKSTQSSYSEFAANEVPLIRAGSPILNNNSIASKAVDIVATACMGTEPACYDGDNVVETLATKLLTKPNNRDTGDEVIYKMVEDFYVSESAKSYVVLVGSVLSAPSQMYRIEPQKVSERVNSHGITEEIRVTNDDYAGDYKLQDDGFRYISDDRLKEIIVIKHPSGRGILNSVREELEVLSTGLNRNGALIKNGGRISTLLAFKDGVSAEEMRARMASIERVIRSKGYGGMLGVNSGEHGVDVKEMGLSPRDMDFSQLYESCRREVYFRCGVPMPLIDNKAATDNNMAAAREMLVINTVLPLCDLIYSTIGSTIAFRDGKKTYITKTNQSIIPEIRSKLLREVKERKDTGIETINELRAHLGLDTTMGGDELLVESRMIPLDSLSANMNAGVNNVAPS